MSSSRLAMVRRTIDRLLTSQGWDQSPLCADSPRELTRTGAALLDDLRCSARVVRVEHGEIDHEPYLIVVVTGPAVHSASVVVDDIDVLRVTAPTPSSAA